MTNENIAFDYEDGERNTCSICYEMYMARTAIGPCQHKACYHCISHWIEQSRSPILNARCPFCRGVIMSLTQEGQSTEPVEQVEEREEDEEDDYSDSQSDSSLGDDDGSEDESDDEDESDNEGESDSNEEVSVVEGDSGRLAEDLWELRGDYDRGAQDMSEMERENDRLTHVRPENRELVKQQLDYLSLFASRVRYADFRVYRDLTPAQLDELVRNMKSIAIGALRFPPSEFLNIGNITGYSRMGDTLVHLESVYRRTVELCRREQRVDLLQSLSTDPMWAELTSQWMSHER